MNHYADSLHRSRPDALKRDIDEYLGSMSHDGLHRLLDIVRTEAKIDELQRIHMATLDADDDVWVQDEAGQTVLLTTRLRELVESLGCAYRPERHLKRKAK